MHGNRLLRTLESLLLGIVLFLAPGPVRSSADEPARSTQDTGAAQRGYRLLRTKAYLSADFPVAAFDATYKLWPRPARDEAEKATPAQRRKMALSRYGLPQAPDEPEGTPLGYVDDGHGGWSLTCLACHGGKVAGRSIPGLGNSHYAFTTLTEEVLRAWARMKDKPTAAHLSRLTLRLGDSNGTTNAQIFSVLLTALRDDEMNVVPDAKPAAFAHHDLDAPPLWNVHKKRRLYIDGFAEKTPRTIMQFTLDTQNDGPTVRGWENDFKDVLAWIESLRPPKYPWAIDRDLAARGEPLFVKTCSRCHGTYGPGGNYPEKMVDIAEVGTDPLRLTGMPREHRRRFGTGWFGEGGKRKAVEDPPGYIAPPLDGIWASAPYFHNGAVPTLWHVFHPDKRPKVWLRTEDGYNQQRVGLEVTELAELPATATSGVERRRYFDTRLAGKSAAGHEFPDELSEDEKRALMEYLKTL